MKIPLKDIRKNHILYCGKHTVKLVEIKEEINEENEKPFILCRFENSEGFIKSCFYNSDEGLPKLIKLFRASGIQVSDNTILDTNDLINKELDIIVSENKYMNEATGQTKKIKIVIDFNPCSPKSLDKNNNMQSTSSKRFGTVSGQKEIINDLEDDLPF